MLTHIVFTKIISQTTQVSEINLCDKIQFQQSFNLNIYFTRLQRHRLHKAPVCHQMIDVFIFIEQQYTPSLNKSDFQIFSNARACWVVVLVLTTFRSD